MFSLQLLPLIFISMLRRQEEKEDVKRRRRQGEGEAEKLRRGDLLVVPRTLFTHFGIYLGGDRSGFHRAGGLKSSHQSSTLRDCHLLPFMLFSFLCFPSFLRVAHFIPDILPVISRDTGQIAQMVTNTRLLLGVLAKVGWPSSSEPSWTIAPSLQNPNTTSRDPVICVCVCVCARACVCSLQRGSVRVDSVDDFAYGSKLLVNTPDKVLVACSPSLTPTPS